TDQEVVAVATVRREQDRVGRQTRGVHRVVAVPRVDNQPIGPRLGAVDVYLGGQSEHRGANLAVEHFLGDTDGVIVVGAVDDDGVGLAVADAGERDKVDVHLGDIGAGEVIDGEGIGAPHRRDVDPLDAVDVQGG